MSPGTGAGPRFGVPAIKALMAGLCVVAIVGCGSDSPTPGAAPTDASVALEPDAPTCVAPESAASTGVGQDHPHAGKPNRISIPALEVAVPVVPIGLTDGRLVPPADPQTLGWWRDGAIPGAARGSAILTGHSVATGGGALDDLEDLRAGDPVTITTTRGEIEYRTTEVVYYSRAEVSSLADILFSQTVPGRLVLSTCSNFDGVSYRGNTLAFAEPRQ